MRVYRQRLFLLAVAAVLTVSLAGCGQKSEPASASAAPSSQGSSASSSLTHEPSSKPPASSSPEEPEESSAPSSGASSAKPSSKNPSKAPSKKPSAPSKVPSSTKPPASSSEAPSHPWINGKVPTTKDTGKEIENSIRLLLQCQDFVNLSGLGGQSFEHAAVTDRQMAFAGVMLTRDEAQFDEDGLWVDKKTFEGRVARYFGQGIADPMSISGPFPIYVEEKYTWPATDFEGYYVFTAKKAFDLGGGYLRVEGVGTKTLENDRHHTVDAVVILKRTSESGYGYQLIAQKFQVD